MGLLIDLFDRLSNQVLHGNVGDLPQIKQNTTLIDKWADP